MSLLSTLIIACTLSSLVLSGDYSKDDKGKYVKTPRPTKHEPHSYDGMRNWEKPSYPKWKKDSKPAWKKNAWEKDSKPTYTEPQEYDHEPMYESETYEKEPVYSWFQNPYSDRTRRSAMQAQLEEGKETVSHIYNPYDIRQRGIVKAQLEERIESDMQELAAYDALETEVSEEDLDGEGVIEAASSHGQTGNMCSSRFGCRSGCCERSRCVEKVRDWASIHYCPAECRGFPFARTGTC
jgi:hypothetical protein